jgi:hypothetical protein
MDEDGNLRGFVVPDDLIEDGGEEGGFALSDKRLEDDWEAWKPQTKAEKRFKNVIDKYAPSSKASPSKKTHPSSPSTGSPGCSSV